MATVNSGIQITNPFYDSGNGIGGADLNIGAGLFSGIGNAINDIFSSQATKTADETKAAGLLVEQQDLTLAAQFAGEEDQYTKEATAVSLSNNVRNSELGIGQNKAAIADNGFALSGSAEDIIRQSHEQAGLTQASTQMQGAITEQGYEEQQQVDTNEAAEAGAAAAAASKAGHDAGVAGVFGAVLQGAGALVSLF